MAVELVRTTMQKQHTLRIVLVVPVVLVVLVVLAVPLALVVLVGLLVLVVLVVVPGLLPLLPLLLVLLVLPVMLVMLPVPGRSKPQPRQPSLRIARGPFPQTPPDSHGKFGMGHGNQRRQSAAEDPPSHTARSLYRPADPPALTALMGRPRLCLRATV